MEDGKTLSALQKYLLELRNLDMDTKKDKRFSKIDISNDSDHTGTQTFTPKPQKTLKKSDIIAMITEALEHPKVVHNSTKLAKAIFNTHTKQFDE